MFAFAIWNRETLFLARDRLGIKPLYYSEDPAHFRFASTPQALIAAGGVDTGIDAVALHHLFTLHAVVPAPRTIFNGIRKLAPGTTVFVSAREAGIPGPPIAAVRIAADALPTTVVLSDANTMIEGRDLSSVDKVQLVARVAFGGTAVTASGDLLGESLHKKGAPENVNVVINRVSP